MSDVVPHKHSVCPISFFFFFYFLGKLISLRTTDWEIYKKVSYTTGVFKQCIETPTFSTQVSILMHLKMVSIHVHYTHVSSDNSVPVCTI